LPAHFTRDFIGWAASGGAGGLADATSGSGFGGVASRRSSDRALPASRLLSPMTVAPKRPGAAGIVSQAARAPRRGWPSVVDKNRLKTRG
jgi:hypothetical protein